MNTYSIPAGFSNFETVEKIFRDNLPAGFKIIKSEAGGKLPGQNGFLGMGKPKVQRHKLGEIRIKQNSYHAAVINFTTTDDVQEGFISVADYVPSMIVQFIRTRVLGLVTNLIFPAIYGTSKKIYAMTDELIMNNFGANKYDSSVGGAMKSMVKGKALKVANSSVTE